MKHFTGTILTLILSFLITATAEAGQSCATHNASDIKARASEYQTTINKYSKKYGVDSRIVTAIITTESCFKTKARSHKNAVGLMQLMPKTAKRWGVSNRRSVDQNIRGGTRYIAHLIKRFNGDIKLAVAAYNAGEGNVDKYHGIPPFKNTRKYVKNVVLVYSKLGGYKLRVKVKQSKRYRKKSQLRENERKKKVSKLDFSFYTTTLTTIKKLVPQG